MVAGAEGQEMKKTITTITCDTCETDISPEFTSYPHKFILHLSYIDVARHSNDSCVYSIMMYPPIQDDLYFCNLNCMSKYQVKT